MEIVYRKKYHMDFVAPGTISFEVKNGEMPGIIGQNGAGKSTLF
jgi:ABC-type multidrug transport system ATPase subunit